MPRVPTLDGNRIQTQRLNVSRDRNPTPGLESFGGGQSLENVNRGARELAGLANDIQKKEADKADQIAILDADQKISALETSILYDPQTGAMNARGKDSFSLTDTVVPEFQKRASDIENSLTTDFQKMSFQKILAQRSSHINNQINRHVSTETRQYDDQVTKSYISNEMNAAIENFHDPERIGLSLERQKGALLSHADRNGLDEETTKQLISETQSKTHSAVISKLLNSGGVNQAKAYYGSNKDQITGEDRIAVDKSLKMGILQADSQSIADSIVAKNGDSLKDALAKARSVKDPDKRDEVVRRVKSQFADARAAKIDAENQAFDSAYQSVEATASLDTVPKQILANLSLSKKQALEKRVSQLKNGLPVQTDIAAYYDLETMAGTPATRDSFLKLNLLEKKHLLSESDFKHFAGLQKAARSGKGVKQLDGIQTKGSIVSSALAAGGIQTGKNAKPNDIKRANEFRRQVDQLVLERQEATGKKVTNEELREITDNLMVNSITDKGYFGFFQTRKKVFELGPEDRPVIKVQDIPVNELNSIKNALRKINRPVTDDDILLLYTEKLNRLRGDNG